MKQSNDFIKTYSLLLNFLSEKKIKYEISGQIIRLIDFDYSFYLVIEDSLNNSADSFNEVRKFENVNYSKFLIFIWFDLWRNKEGVIKSKIKHLCQHSKKIHARKTAVKLVSKENSTLFFEENHLNTPILGYKRLGLYIDNELIALASFAKRRLFKDNTHSAELLLFTTKNGIHVNGGLSKLISHFIRIHSIDSLMTYIDLDWSNGEKFNKIGFVNSNSKQPIYFILNQNNRLLTTEITRCFSLGSLKSIYTVQNTY